MGLGANMRRTITRWARGVVAAGCVAAVAGCVGGPSGRGQAGALHSAADCWDVPINRVQVIGSHNSYRLMPPEPVLAAIEAARPGSRQALEYEHPALARQLDLGLRLLEIDIYADPEGGRYARPVTLGLLGGDDPRPFVDGAMDGPGFKVIHIAGVDAYSSCLTLAACLGEIKAWSDANREHGLITVTLNLKEDGPSAYAPAALPFDAEAFAQLDALVLDVFGRDRILTPDDVRGEAATLRGAVTNGGWPTLRDTRGRVLLALDGPLPSSSDRYREHHPSLSGRMMFAEYPSTADEAAFFVVWDLKGREDEIAALVDAGFLVRTGGDIGTVEARSNDPSRLRAAIASGAQLIASDYYPGHISPFATDYLAVFDTGGVVTCGVRARD